MYTARFTSLNLACSTPPINHRFGSRFEKGNEFFPDLTVSWRPNIDARSSNTREGKLNSAGAMLLEFSILSELKVTGSTGKSTPGKHVTRDLAKLAVFAIAHQRAAQEAKGELAKRTIAMYLVVIDNYRRNNISSRHNSKAQLRDLLSKFEPNWPSSISPPTVLLVTPSEMLVYRNFALDSDEHRPLPATN